MGGFAAGHARVAMHVDGRERGWAGESPLRSACFAGHLKTIQFLVKDCKCEVDARDEGQDTPFVLAAQNGHLEVMKWLAQEGNADIKAVDEENMNAVGRAAMNGHVEVVKWLIEHGVDGNHVDADGDTPLIIACSDGKKDVADFLVKCVPSLWALRCAALRASFIALCGIGALV